MDAIATSTIVVLFLAVIVLGSVAWFSPENIGPQSDETQNDTSGDQEEAGQRDEHSFATQIARLINAQTHEHRAYRNETKRENREKAFREWATIVLLLLAFGAAFWSAIIFHSQLNIMEAEQRPWVGMTGLGPARQTPRPVTGEDFFIGAFYSDVGKTPAFHVKPTFQAKFLEEGRRPDIPPAPCDYCGDGDVMFPGVPISRSPHVEGSELTSDRMARFSAKKASIWLTGRIDYLDVGGNPHKTFVCYKFEADGSFISCDIPDSNYAD